MSEAGLHPATAIVLSGPPGVGKTTTAFALSARLGAPAVDLDEVIGGRAGEPVPSLIARLGEASFRTVEAETLRHLPSRLRVVALGGGTLTSPAGRRAAQDLGPVLGLTAPTEELERRLDQPSLHARPILAQRGLRGLLEDRRNSYAAVDRTVDAEGPVEVVADRVHTSGQELQVRLLKLGTANTRVVLGHQLHDAAAQAVAAQGPTRPVVLLLDEGVPASTRAIYRSRLEALGPLSVHELPGGEEAKQWTTAAGILEAAARAGAGRQSVVVALGGGAVCDLAGFVASILGRGAGLVLVPSTLLAQLDASIGGKTALNLAAGRNLIGTFHPANTVLIDHDLLTSLPPAELKSGLAELFKIALISDPTFFGEVRAARGASPVLVGRAIEAKAALVAADPLDRGVRRHLNLGHTLGHALERASNFSIRHGEAVAIGIAAIARYSAQKGWISEDLSAELVSALEDLGLPSTAPIELLAAARAHLANDKKSGNGRLTLITIHGLAKIAVQELFLDEAREALVRNGGAR
ncbi:MAG: bifunctional shikimate kinase/3-dehydroquinate synthase [Deltaproteobacteria bacterium]|nr:bifunctional shikimate kinase/3-dehydroquinate synthase [Deltaproteobacteria bacterium]